MDGVGSSCALPDDPVLAEFAEAFKAARAWAFVVDREWRMVYATDDIRLSSGALRELVPLPTEEMLFGATSVALMLSWTGQVFSIESLRAWLATVGPWLLHDTPGGRDAVRGLVDPRLADVVDALTPSDAPAALSHENPGARSAGVQANLVLTWMRIRDASGRLAGTAMISKPTAPMALLGTMATIGDLQHFGRVLSLAKAARRPAAILFADLEASSNLARRLSTAGYFTLGRRLVRAADRCVVHAGGIVGRHAGDGVVAFFLAEHSGSESRAARACIHAMRELRAALADIALRSELEAEDVVLRFGLHWGSTLHVGQITTAARAEVDALGDEMNEAARIEACATGGRALASKALIERLEDREAQSLGLDPRRLTYVALANLPTATEKARRDAPAIAVCEL